MNIRPVKAGLRIAEVPSFERPRIHGKSNLHTFRDGFRVLKVIVRERRRMEEAADSAAALPSAGSIP